MSLLRPALTLSLSARGSAPAALAWERYADLDRWRDWSPQVRGVEADGRRLREGLRGSVVGPAGVRVPFTVGEVDDRSWSWDVELPGAVVHLHHVVLDDVRGSATTLVLRGPAPLVLGYAPLARVALGRLVRP